MLVRGEVRASALHAEGRRFESYTVHQNSNEARPRRSEVRDHSRVHMSVGVKLEHLLYTQKVAGFQPLHRPP